MEKTKIRLESKEPMKVAQYLLDNVYFTPIKGGNITSLVYYGGKWWYWCNGRWEQRSEEQVEDALWKDLEDLTYEKRGEGGVELRRLGPDASKVGNVKTALRSKVRRDFRNTPVWLVGHGSKPEPVGYVPFRDVLVPLDEEMGLVERDATWFDPGVLSVDWDMEAECPTWVRCLEQWSCGDPKWVTLLQRWFGYCITNHREYAKWLLMSGKSRAGKGTIVAVLQELLGNGAFVSRGLEDLTKDFGLDGLQSAKVLSFTEVSSMEGKVAEQVASVLKRVLGGDPQHIAMKYKAGLENQVIAAAPMVQINGVPELPDRMNSVSIKMLALPFNWSAEEDGNQPDPFLKQKLMRELGGIGAWAMRGARELHQLGYGEKWPVPDAAAQLREDFREENNPYDLFLESRFFKNPEGFVSAEELYRHWVEWCKETGEKQFISRNQIRKVLLKRTSWKLQNYRPRGVDGRLGRRGLVGLSQVKPR